MNKPRIRTDYIEVCETFGVNPNREYFNMYSIGDALWKAYQMGLDKSLQSNTESEED